MSLDSFREVVASVHSFDVLLSRDSSYLDTGFIPKFWSHAGTFINQKRDPFDGNVVHFLSEGMVEWDLYKFCKTDEICILRPKFEFDQKVVLDRIEAARGKGYDFGFNFDNFNRLSCSEFIVYMFQGYEHGIKSEISWGKTIIPPTNIISGNFELIFTSKTT